MYYILNETNQIIAADEGLLNLCGLSHIDELSLKIALGDIKFDPTSETDLTITTDKGDETLSISKISLSSMLGRLTLVNIQVEEIETQESSMPMDLDTDLLSVESDIEDKIQEPEESVEEETELFDLVLEEKAEENIEKIEDSLNLISDDVETFDLGLEEKSEAVTVDDSPIVIDIDKISQEIGVSNEDYDTFLNEYIDTALGLEQDLRSMDETTRSSAVGTLSHLSDVLQLPVIGAHIEKIASASEETQREAVESFYAVLSKLTTSADTKEDEKMDLFEIGDDVVKAPADVKGFGTIDLSDVKPIHFDFQLEEAAKDLSLPVELIEEFVHDFIEQGHEETKNMLKAYEEGDLEKIQKIGHLLKGASSNLRIKDLSDTLYKIQFCEDSNDLEHLIKDYWGHFLSFEIQINALAK
jgi:rRNA maturation endonuclease Nob1